MYIDFKIGDHYWADARSGSDIQFHVENDCPNHLEMLDCRGLV